MRSDTPELEKAINMLREIYWREYGRGWRDAVANVKRVLETSAETTDPKSVADPAHTQEQ